MASGAERGGAELYMVAVQILRIVLFIKVGILPFSLSSVIHGVDVGRTINFICLPSRFITRSSSHAESTQQFMVLPTLLLCWS
jgi:hypothetical protein